MSREPAGAPPHEDEIPVPVSCRSCGAWHYEVWHDAFPGHCVVCSDDAIWAMSLRLADDLAARPSPAAVLGRHFRRLVEVGMLPAAAGAAVNELAALFGVPCPKEALAARDATWERAAAASRDEGRPPHPCASPPRRRRGGLGRRAS
jgi:hypothetical protein